MHPAANPYQDLSVSTATPGQLVQMLYDRALVAVARAGNAQSDGGPGTVELINHELLRAQDIVLELHQALDHERGGQIARNLEILYSFCLERLVQANLTKDLRPLDAVSDTLQGLRDAWQEACSGLPVAVS